MSSSSAKPHTHNDGSSTRSYTPEQKAAVLRVKRCKVTEFYDILGLESVKSTCSDGEIKKAYRKLSLLTHPDKNGFGGADEAFKLVSRAFQVLSDPDKKSKFDKYGGDPDARFSQSSASGASPFSGFASQRHGGGGGGRGMYEEEISPEELFRQFFGGGGGGFGGPFGGFGQPGFVFNVGGGPGVRVRQFGGQNPQRRPRGDAHAANAEATSPLRALQSLLPLLLLFLLPLLSSLLSGASETYPSVRFDAAIPPQTFSHTTPRMGVQYYINPSDVADYTSKKWKELDKYVEGRYVQVLSADCEREQAQKQRAVQEAQGFFFRDEERHQRAMRMESPSCRKLEGMGYQVNYGYRY
ncbi:Chaperone protein dnaJ [Oleoguttula sp. CCFEE 5521]